MAKQASALEKAIEVIKERSKTDVAFRDLALKDARAALRQIGHEGEYAVVFTDGSGVARSPKGVLEVILYPAAQESIIEELSEADLEQVAGGGDGSGPTWNP